MDAPVEFSVTRHVQQARMRLGRVLPSKLRQNRLLLWVVVVPTLLSVLYFGLLAHDVYVSESHFVVRTQQRQSITGLGSLLQGAGITQGNEDVYSVQDYLTSRDALTKLDGKLPLRQAFSETGADLLTRFPALDGDRSFEGLYRYYVRRVVTTDLDTSSAILTLTVRAFSAEDAYRINETLLELSEQLVNDLNERARTDLIKFAAADVDGAEQATRVAVLALSRFRNSRAVFDPERQSGLQMEQVGRLQEELIGTRKQIADVQEVAGQNPQLPVLENRVKVLQAAIASETAKVAGDKQSLSTRSAEYEDVVLQREFAAKRLEIALASLEQARENATKQQVYLERIAGPGKPDKAIEPRRLRAIVATLLLSLVVFGVLSLLTAAIREHAD